MPDVATLATYYPPQYHSFNAAGLLSRLKHRSRLKRLASLVSANAPVVLDYGCGHGAFIRKVAAQATSWSFWGSRSPHDASGRRRRMDE